MRSKPQLSRFFCLLSFVFVVGCSNAPSIEPPSFKPKKIAAKAMELYDADSDGALSKSELEAAPGLLDGMKGIDANGDEQMDEAEIAAKIQQFVDSKNGSQNSIFRFRMANGRPVEGAKVTLEPEEFIADAIVTATGKTNWRGETELKCSATPFGIQPGFYRIHISKQENGKEMIDSKYNEASLLGVEVSGTTRGDLLGGYEYTLK